MSSSWTNLGEFDHQRIHMGIASASLAQVAGALTDVLIFSDG